MNLPDTIYVDGVPYRVLQHGLELGRDGAVHDASGARVRGRGVDPVRAAAWLETGVGTAQEPKSPKPKKRASKKTTKKGGA